MLEIKRRGPEFIGPDEGCHCGGGDPGGLTLRTDSGVVARSSSVLSRSVKERDPRVSETM